MMICTLHRDLLRKIATESFHEWWHHIILNSWALAHIAKMDFRESEAGVNLEKLDVDGLNGSHDVTTCTFLHVSGRRTAFYSFLMAATLNFYSGHFLTTPLP